jgi:hypothetical protein
MSNYCPPSPSSASFPPTPLSSSRQCPSTSSTLTTMSNSSALLPDYPGTTSALTFDLIYDLTITTQHSNDPSTQDFEFEEIFTFTDHSRPTTGSSQPSSSSFVPLKGCQAPIRQPQPQPQPQRRNWSNLPFACCNVPQSATSSHPVHSKRTQEQPLPQKAQGVRSGARNETSSRRMTAVHASPRVERVPVW